MKVLSLFSGVGGFDLGLERAGMKTVFQCEWDKHATKILERHWPHVPRWDDVSTLTGEHILRHAPVIDVVAWGSPCQDLSVAGKRAGLQGARSGLFHEGVRIIKELRELTNGKYPRISIWENVAGALSSGAGADFGQVLTEMDEAGACFSEWRILDAQYFGVPQRRRRVFLISVFDSATAARCPDPLLPVSEGVRWHPATGNTARQEPASEASAGVGSGGAGVETFTKGKRPQTATDDETWDENRPAPTLNAFDQGDTRATTLIAFENSYRDAARIATEGITNTLSAKMGTGGNNTPMVAFATNQRAEVRELDDKAVALSAEPGTNQQTYVAFPIQDGREMEKNQNGIGVADDGTPAYTLDQTGAQAVAYGLQGNMIGRQDHNGPQGAGISHPNDPMFSLTTTDRHAVAYDEYNDSLGGEVHHALRAGTKQSTGVMLFQDSEFGVKEYDTAGTLRAGRIPEHQMVGVEATGFKPGASADARTIGYEEGLSPSLEAGGGGNNKPAVITPTMAVRRLTPLECERLMGWPDDWTAGQSDTHRYKQCGNGVASPVAQWIGQQLMELDK